MNIFSQQIYGELTREINQGGASIWGATLVNLEF